LCALPAELRILDPVEKQQRPLKIMRMNCALEQEVQSREIVAISNGVYFLKNISLIVAKI